MVDRFDNTKVIIARLKVSQFVIHSQTGEVVWLRLASIDVSTGYFTLRIPVHRTFQ